MVIIINNSIKRISANKTISVNYIPSYFFKQLYNSAICHIIWHSLLKASSSLDFPTYRIKISCYVYSIRTSTNLPYTNWLNCLNCTYGIWHVKYLTQLQRQWILGYIFACMFLCCSLSLLPKHKSFPIAVGPQEHKNHIIWHNVWGDFMANFSFWVFWVPSGSDKSLRSSESECCFVIKWMPHCYAQR